MNPVRLLCAALALLGCAACAAPRPERIVLGVALSASDHPAMRMAVEEINAAGGIDGVRLELEGLEWRFVTRPDAESLIQWADRLSTNDELLAVVGHGDSSTTLAAASLYNQRRIPTLVTIATHPDITALGDWVYRLCPSDTFQGRVLAEYAVHDLGARRIAVFYVNDDYGKGLAHIFQQRVEQLDGRIVSNVMHRDTPQSDDLAMIATVIERLAETGSVDAYVLFQRATAAQFTIAEIKRRDGDVPILGSENLAHEALRHNAPELMTGLRIADVYAPDPDDRRALEFRTRMERRTGHAPDYSESLAYDAVYLFRDAVLRGGFDRAGVKAYLDGLTRSGETIAGVGGSYSFDPAHDGRRQLRIVSIDPEGGEHVLKVFPAQD